MRKLLANKNPDSAQTSNVRTAALQPPLDFALAANDRYRLGHVRFCASYVGAKRTNSDLTPYALTVYLIAVT